MGIHVPAPAASERLWQSHTAGASLFSVVCGLSQQQYRAGGKYCKTPLSPFLTFPDFSSEVCWKHTGWTMEVINKTLVQTRDSN